MTLERYRGLRGFARHVLPFIRAGRAAYWPRTATPTLMAPFKGRRGVCLWCDDPTASARHSWHPSCVLYYAVASGKRMTMGGKWVAPPAACGLCGRTQQDCDDENNRGREVDWAGGLDYKALRLELDHRVAIGIAARTGPREHARAFLPDNLWWLCSDCHLSKTTDDRAQMARLDRLSRQGEFAF